jgi:hypothetical protein
VKGERSKEKIHRGDAKGAEKRLKKILTADAHRRTRTGRFKAQRNLKNIHCLLLILKIVKVLLNEKI